MPANPKKILITGIVGFIGFSFAKKLCLYFPDIKIYGIDNISNDDFNLNLGRLEELKKNKNIKFIKGDIGDLDLLKSIENFQDIDFIFHFAAQPGVRGSVDKPIKYIEQNINNTAVILEFARLIPNLNKFIYASSSSIYGSSQDLSFKENNQIHQPLSLYAATKQSKELICSYYSRMFNIKAVGFRFFTVYGPWGRPDMAIFKIANLIRNRQKIKLVGNGQFTRDFTFIDDINEGLINAMSYQVKKDDIGFQNEVFNLGFGQKTSLNRLVELISNNLGIKADIEYVNSHPSDMQSTLSDITKAQNLLNYHPKTNIEDGIGKFIIWFKEYYNLK